MTFGSTLAIRDAGSRMFASLDAAEIALVARTAATCDRLRLGAVARGATRLGNGWLYPLLSIFVIAMRLDEAVRFIASAAGSLIVAFIVYPLLKTFLGRARPCDYDPALAREIEPLDHYSCPSGHAMTAAAYAVPLAFAYPAATPLAIAVCVVISWSRMALGHHYLTDVVFGTLLGGGVAMTVTVAVY